ncbi:MAG: hypothetical protein H0X51_01280 [Parachlamydiaceae bacterium]|nr:hypothetical protein [Parachlamydiaceae bacterium]
MTSKIIAVSGKLTLPPLVPSPPQNIETSKTINLFISALALPSERETKRGALSSLTGERVRKDRVQDLIRQLDFTVLDEFFQIDNRVADLIDDPEIVEVLSLNIDQPLVEGFFNDCVKSHYRLLSEKNKDGYLSLLGIIKGIWLQALNLPKKYPVQQLIADHLHLISMLSCTLDTPDWGKAYDSSRLVNDFFKSGYWFVCYKQDPKTKKNNQDERIKSIIHTLQVKHGHLILSEAIEHWLQQPLNCDQDTHFTTLTPPKWKRGQEFQQQWVTDREKNDKRNIGLPSWCGQHNFERFIHICVDLLDKRRWRITEQQTKEATESSHKLYHNYQNQLIAALPRIFTEEILHSLDFHQYMQFRSNDFRLHSNLLFLFNSFPENSLPRPTTNRLLALLKIAAVLSPLEEWLVLFGNRSEEIGKLFLRFTEKELPVTIGKLLKQPDCFFLLGPLSLYNFRVFGEIFALLPGQEQTKFLQWHLGEMDREGYGVRFINKCFLPYLATLNEEQHHLLLGIFIAFLLKDCLAYTNNPTKENHELLKNKIFFIDLCATSSNSPRWQAHLMKIGFFKEMIKHGFWLVAREDSMSRLDFVAQLLNNPLGLEVLTAIFNEWTESGKSKLTSFNSECPVRVLLHTLTGLLNYRREEDSPPHYAKFNQEILHKALSEILSPKLLGSQEFFSVCKRTELLDVLHFYPRNLLPPPATLSKPAAILHSFRLLTELELWQIATQEKPQALVQIYSRFSRVTKEKFIKDLRECGNDNWFTVVSILAYHCNAYEFELIFEGLFVEQQKELMDYQLHGLTLGRFENLNPQEMHFFLRAKKFLRMAYSIENPQVTGAIIAFFQQKDVYPHILVFFREAHIFLRRFLNNNTFLCGFIFTLSKSQLADFMNFMRAEVSDFLPRNKYPTLTELLFFYSTPQTTRPFVNKVAGHNLILKNLFAYLTRSLLTEDYENNTILRENISRNFIDLLPPEKQNFFGEQLLAHRSHLALYVNISSKKRVDLLQNCPIEQGLVPIFQSLLIAFQKASNQKHYKAAVVNLNFFLDNLSEERIEKLFELVFIDSSISQPLRIPLVRYLFNNPIHAIHLLPCILQKNSYLKLFFTAIPEQKDLIELFEPRGLLTVLFQHINVEQINIFLNLVKTHSNCEIVLAHLFKNFRDNTLAILYVRKILISNDQLRIAVIKKVKINILSPLNTPAFKKVLVSLINTYLRDLREATEGERKEVFERLNYLLGLIELEFADVFTLFCEKFFANSTPQDFKAYFKEGILSNLFSAMPEDILYIFLNMVPTNKYCAQILQAMLQSDSTVNDHTLELIAKFSAENPKLQQRIDATKQ